MSSPADSWDDNTPASGQRDTRDVDDPSDRPYEGREGSGDGHWNSQIAIRSSQASFRSGQHDPRSSGSSHGRGRSRGRGGGFNQGGRRDASLNPPFGNPQGTQESNSPASLYGNNQGAPPEISPVPYYQRIATSASLREQVLANARILYQIGNPDIIVTLDPRYGRQSAITKFLAILVNKDKDLDDCGIIAANVEYSMAPGKLPVTLFHLDYAYHDLLKTMANTAASKVENLILKNGF